MRWLYLTNDPCCLAAELTFELYSATSVQAGAGTSGDPIQVSFQDDDGTWSEPQLYYDPESDEALNPGVEFAKSFTMPSIPRGVRFITQDNINAWSYWKVWIPRECPIVYAEDPNGEPPLPWNTSCAICCWQDYLSCLC